MITLKQSKVVNLFKFSHSEGDGMKKTPDVKLVYKDTYEQGEACVNPDSCNKTDVVLT